MGDIAKENGDSPVQAPVEAKKKGDEAKEVQASAAPDAAEVEKKENSEAVKPQEPAKPEAPVAATAATPVTAPAAAPVAALAAALVAAPAATPVAAPAEAPVGATAAAPVAATTATPVAATAATPLAALAAAPVAALVAVPAAAPAAAAEVKIEDKLTSTEGIQEPSGNSSAEREEWHKRELKLLMKIKELEAGKKDASVSALNHQLKEREEELVLTRARVQNLETQLQAALGGGGLDQRQLVDSVKLQHEELLNKARGMIFDKTKIVKNQELQIEALTTQVQSLKDINQITKDLLEIRNSEIKAMEDRYAALEARLKGEKEKFDLLIRRAQVNCNINDDVKKEYETQMAIFKELKGQYEQKVQALVAENNRLKEARKQGPST